MDAKTLAEAIVDAGCPIISARVGLADDRTTWSFEPAPEATSQQINAGNNVISTINAAGKGIIAFDEFIRRWTNAEYRLLLQHRATVISGSGAMSIIKKWDIAAAQGSVDPNKQLMQSLKLDIVAAGILTQARANEIFG